MTLTTEDLLFLSVRLRSAAHVINASQSHSWLAGSQEQTSLPAKKLIALELREVAEALSKHLVILEAEIAKEEKPQ